MGRSTASSSAKSNRGSALRAPGPLEHLPSTKPDGVRDKLAPTAPSRDAYEQKQGFDGQRKEVLGGKCPDGGGGGRKALPLAPGTAGMSSPGSSLIRRVASGAVPDSLGRGEISSVRDVINSNGNHVSAGGGDGFESRREGAGQPGVGSGGIAESCCGVQEEEGGGGGGGGVPNAVDGDDAGGRRGEETTVARLFAAGDECAALSGSPCEDPVFGSGGIERTAGDGAGAEVCEGLDGGPHGEDAGERDEEETESIGRGFSVVVGENGGDGGRKGVGREDTPDSEPDTVTK